MFVVVCYDVPNDRRRNKIGKVLEGFGTRVQKSVFECDIKPENVKILKQKLARILKTEDSMRYYYLCAQCISRVEVINGPPVTQTQLYFAV